MAGEVQNGGGDRSGPGAFVWFKHSQKTKMTGWKSWKQEWRCLYLLLKVVIYTVAIFSFPGCIYFCRENERKFHRFREPKLPSLERTALATENECLEDWLLPFCVCGFAWGQHDPLDIRIFHFGKTHVEIVFFPTTLSKSKTIAILKWKMAPLGILKFWISASYSTTCQRHMINQRFFFKRTFWVILGEYPKCCTTTYLLYIWVIYL